MTSTSTFQGLENRPNSSRVLKPPGGGSSNIFSALEEPASKPHKMASNIFGPPEEISVPKRSNPPGGKDSGIFSEPSPVPSQQSTIPAGGRSTEVFGEPAPPTAVRTHPNKPKSKENKRVKRRKKRNQRSLQWMIMNLIWVHAHDPTTRSLSLLVVNPRFHCSRDSPCPVNPLQLSKILFGTQRHLVYTCAQNIC
ncbi:jupiter microtubule associated homolog 2-like isoform X1 [Hypanus sabinus]|uniref:jupiter microtubule associated homolog 2-like isoform X1 n=1 Tax=Hypanus sabinus TaxID=79690 RepID=UPI0028C510FE|nr:jupiter microtubule associated homolog 2-like isoform X1 [Hypanus sabinus]